MNRRARSGAFTLIEVLIALVVLGVGVMAAVQLQATSLRASSQAEGIQDATLVADAELDFRLQMSLSPVTSANCLAPSPRATSAA
ncbi:MAG: prepilin-type N-terminal cleavage/methylation domain-containing protein [Trueperaceae bacterium]|nr:prepilin-type N-terminal cleavage/methylation domain-containing protein [Trueperaceae bacterium]